MQRNKWRWWFIWKNFYVNRWYIMWMLCTMEVAIRQQQQQHKKSDRSGSSSISSKCFAHSVRWTFSCSMASKNKWCAEQSYIHNKMKYSEFSRHVQIILLIFQKKRTKKKKQDEEEEEKIWTLATIINTSATRKSIISQVAVWQQQQQSSSSSSDWTRREERAEKSYPRWTWCEMNDNDAHKNYERH